MYQFSVNQAQSIMQEINSGLMTTESVMAALVNHAPDYPVTNLLVKDEGSYRIARLPGSNSDGILQSDTNTDDPCGTMELDGLFYS